MVLAGVGIDHFLHIFNICGEWVLKKEGDGRSKIRASDFQVREINHFYC